MKNINNTIINVALPIKLFSDFCYLTTKETCQVTIGSRVIVPFGNSNRQVIGVVVATNAETNIPLSKLKNVIQILDAVPIFNTSIFSYIKWIANYYQHPLGLVIENALPQKLRKISEINSAKKIDNSSRTPAIYKYNPICNLNLEQQQVLKKIKSSLDKFRALLLFGITGSGKTVVFIEAINFVIQNHKQAIVLIPEISLTPQTLNRFNTAFPDQVAIYHSKMSMNKRYESFLHAKLGTKKIIIGTRSASFLPLKDPGIFIIDEEHDSSYKQQEMLRYSARDSLIKRAQIENCPIVLASATPSIESWHNANSNKFELLSLTQRANNAKLPDITVLDTKGNKLNNNLHHKLIKEINICLERQQQVMLFINRRGFAPVLTCYNCGFKQICKRCDTKMVIHYYLNSMRCHCCNWQCSIPNTCPDCNNPVNALGTGTQRLELALAKLFPEAKIARVDRDSMQKKDAFDKLIAAINAQQYNILIGTQMLAKGHHFPNLTLVAILDIDSAFYSSDFRATEHMGQLITQVAGRSGRDQIPGKVILQTAHPNNKLLNVLLTQGYKTFAKFLVSERQQANLPPFSYQAMLHSNSKKLDTALKLLYDLKLKLPNNNNVNILGPIPATIEKRNNKFYAQLLLQSTKRQELHKMLALAKNWLINNKSRVNWAIDVDPITEL